MRCNKTDVQNANIQRRAFANDPRTETSCGHKVGFRGRRHPENREEISSGFCSVDVKGHKERRGKARQEDIDHGA